MQTLNLAVLLDIAPPSVGLIGGFGAVVFGLFLTAIALAFFLLFRKKLSTKISGGISIGIFLLGVIGGIVILAGALIYDSKARSDYDDIKRRQNQDMLDRMKEESERNKSESNNNFSQNAR
ncbi:MAG TPA: hypothetical protein PKY82_16705 [Pyrinomonadaceae bacterium]|nr:hypothetical protein [Pyrinomonadaceae bacterium]